MTGRTQSPSGGPELTQADLSRIAKLLQDDAGIQIPQEKVSLVQARLSRRLRSTGLTSYAEYCKLVESAQGQTERAEMLSALTTNVTKFFREPHHFDDLRDRILPPLIDRARKGGSVRIWSAACSSGEEPYSVAMTILGLDRKAHEWDIRILATDIDRQILAKARTGLYRASALEPVRAYIPDGLVEKSASDEVRMGSELRSLITFNQLNLHKDWPIKRRLDVIICRNVVIYFEKEAENRVWQRMSDMLTPGGFIMIGHSERIPVERTPGLSLDGITTYRKRSPAAQ